MAAVRDLRERRLPASVEEIEAFKVDVMAGFVLARASAGLTDSTIRADVSNLEQVRAWFGRPLWEMEPSEVLRAQGNSVVHTGEVLDSMGVLLDDRIPTFDAFLEQKLTDLAPGIAAETRRWAIALKDGGPRNWPRAQTTVAHYLRRIRPYLLEWSQQYDHLRQVTRQDLIKAVVDLEGRERVDTLAALRSLFRWAKKNNVVFANPTARIRVGRAARPIWQPLQPDEINRTVQAATTPQAKVFVALAAIHATRPSVIRTLTVDDVDLPNRRITISGRVRTVDDLTYRVLDDWLRYRRQRWPHTANPHLLVSRESAVKLGPVSAVWVGRILRGLPATIERLRIDRQLEEAIVSGADPLLLAQMFGVSGTTAVRYAENARVLLESPDGTHSLV